MYFIVVFLGDCYCYYYYYYCCDLYLCKTDLQKLNAYEMKWTMNNFDHSFIHIYYTFIVWIQDLGSRMENYKLPFVWIRSIFFPLQYYYICSSVRRATANNILVQQRNWTMNSIRNYMYSIRNNIHKTVALFTCRLQIFVCVFFYHSHLHHASTFNNIAATNNSFYIYCLYANIYRHAAISFKFHFLHLSLRIQLSVQDMIRIYCVCVLF